MKNDELCLDRFEPIKLSYHFSFSFSKKPCISCSNSPAHFFHNIRTFTWRSHLWVQRTLIINNMQSFYVYFLTFSRCILQDKSSNIHVYALLKIRVMLMWFNTIWKIKNEILFIFFGVYTCYEQIENRSGFRYGNKLKLISHIH